MSATIEVVTGVVLLAIPATVIEALIGYAWQHDVGDRPNVGHPSAPVRLEHVRPLLV